ncbi:MAG: hypothetical protein AB7S39_22350 [Gemmatimonadales bacterium]
MLLALTLLLQTKAAAPKPMWTGNLTLVIKGAGRIDAPLGGVKRHVTWKVDRSATGTVVLDRMFKGGGIAGTPNTRDTTRYETWIANASQPLTMQVSDTGTYFGQMGAPTQIGLDVIRVTCPSAASPDFVGQLRSSILQFDYEQGTYSWEAPRLYTKCDTSTLRTPKAGPAAWRAKAPFELVSPVELQFEMVHRLFDLDGWTVITGPFKKGDTEIVMSRKLTFRWGTPLEEKSPVEAELTLVLRKRP